MKNLFKASLMACMITAVSLPAVASITFSQGTIFVDPGQTGISVLATLANTDTANTEFLNGDNVNLPGPFTVNDEFFANTPPSLAPLTDSGLIELFTFDVAPGAAAGPYIATYDLFGGLGAGNESNFDQLDEQTFTVVVTPEPSTLVLVGSALLFLTWRRHQRLKALR
jgi:PEP-CTERM motif